jgi:hypothetical protein
VKSNEHTFAKKIWLAMNPERPSLDFSLLSFEGLSDILAFWKRMFQADVWPSLGLNQAAVDDVLAVRLYLENIEGNLRSCHGCSPSATCADTLLYPRITKRLISFNLSASYSGGTLGLDEYGHSTFAAGVVEVENLTSTSTRYLFKDGNKQLRFWKGIPQLLTREVHWISLWGYLLPDEPKLCARKHLLRIRERHSCRCADMCCSQYLRSRYGRCGETILSLFISRHTCVSI